MLYLNCHSWFSFQYGVMPVKEVLHFALQQGVEAMALTDINNTSGMLDFIRLAPRYNIKPVVGIDFRNGAAQRYICLAKNNEGVHEMNVHLTYFRQAKEEVPEDAPLFQHCFVIYPWHKGFRRQLSAHEFVGINPADIPVFRLYGKEVAADKCVVLAPFTFRAGGKKDFNAHRLLRAIYNNVLLSKLPVTEQGRQGDVLLPAAYLQQQFADFPEAIANTRAIMAACNVAFEFGVAKNKRCFGQSEEQDKKLLEEKALQGLAYRYKESAGKIKERFDSELKTIFELGFTAYFLINWDMVRFAKEEGFFHIGRGSGANSIIAYCLGITDVDPIELDLYFERFINPARRNPPDFDIDFPHTDRDRVRQYLMDTYPGHAALVGNYNNFERKSCIRQVGKVFGLPDDEIAALQLDSADKKNVEGYGALVLQYSDYIKGMPNMLGIHACGILISELPLTYYSALELMPVGFPSVQFSMLEAEDVGLYKYDILSQRGLGHIKDAVELIKANKGEEIDIHRIQDFKKDPVLRQYLKEGNTIGCFYIESPAMRQLMRKLQVEDYLGLVAASSVIRPGVAHSGMMRQYILRFRYPEKRKEAHPELLSLMPETYGVMVYQEDVIKVAHHYAGLTLEEADVMRRGMSGKFRSREEFQQVQEKFFSNCDGKGIPREQSAEVWRQIESFAGFSFAKGHSASYAVESYQSLFLRAYYPIEFITGVLNNFGGFYSTEFYLHQARMLGATVELPCVNRGSSLAVLTGTTIYMGLCLIKDMETGTIRNILQARQQDGEFSGLHDFVKRVAISLEQLRILIRIKAFRFTGKTAKELLWEAHMLLSRAKKTSPRKELFETPPANTTLPALECGRYEDALDEIKILSFPYVSPFSVLSRQYSDTVTAKDIRDHLKDHLGKVVYITGYYVNIKQVYTIHGEKMFFGSFTDREGYLFDTVHFPPSISKYPFTGKGCYLIKGTVIEEFDVPSIEVSHMQRIPMVVE
jgi:error-prone DNA polymerase